MVLWPHQHHGAAASSKDEESRKGGRRALFGHGLEAWVPIRWQRSMQAKVFSLVEVPHC